MNTMAFSAKSAPPLSGARRLLALADRHGERFLLLLFYALIITTVVIDVVRRFVFSYSSVWGEEPTTPAWPR